MPQDDSSIPLADSAPSPITLWIDASKGISIALIILYHITKRFFGWQGVHVFVVLSGFTLTYSCLIRERSYNRQSWMARRVRRVLPAYWLAVLAGFGLAVLANAAWGDPLDHAFPRLLRQFCLDMLLLRNFSDQTMFGDPNAALWFVPFILGFYLVFPFLYRSATRSRSGPAKVLAIALVLEFAYRGLAIKFLNGMPVGFGAGFLPMLGNVGHTRDHIAGLLEFQRWAPFGLFISRLGEFAFGMVGAIWIVRRKWERVASLRRVSTFAIAALAWAMGNWMIYRGAVGWIFADALIAFGFTLLLLQLSAGLQSMSQPLFRACTAVGRSSYYLYLVHMPVFYIFSSGYRFWSKSPAWMGFAAGLTVASVWGATRLLGGWDRRNGLA